MATWASVPRRRTPQPGGTVPPGAAPVWHGVRSAVLAARMAAAVRLAAGHLEFLERRAGCIPAPELRRQALGSLRHKAFHSLGAATFAAAVPLRRGGAMVRFCVAYQTLSDYLDNVCDRSRPLGSAPRRRLHQAMVAALAPAGPPRPPADPGDGGYLGELVANCREAMAGLGVSEAALNKARQLAAAYASMQARKHAAPGVRRRLVASWAHRLLRAGRPAPAGGLAWWEFAAAAGSTLGVFALVAAGARGAGEAALRSTLRAYFPWICAWHILLDYAVDLDEDRACGELNFVACYPRGAAVQRLAGVFRRARALAGGLWEPAFHRLVVAGMAALYLSDPKAARLAPLLRCLEQEEPWVARLGPPIRAWRRRHPAPPQVAPLVAVPRPGGAPRAAPAARAPEGAGPSAGECGPPNPGDERRTRVP